MIRKLHSALLVAFFGYCVFSSLAIGRAQTVEADVGSHTISGRIVDLEGKGLAGVLVRLELYDQAPRTAEPMSLGGEPPPVTLEAALVKASERFESQRGRTYEAQTDATGTYSIESLPDARYSLNAYKRDYWIKTPVGGWSGLEGRVPDLVARPVIPVRIRVLMPDGSDADEAVLVFGDGRLPSIRIAPIAWSPTEPVVRIPVGYWPLTMVHGPFELSGRIKKDTADYASETRFVQIAEEAIVEPLVFQLEHNYGVRGRVSLDENRDTFWRGSVFLLALAPDAAVNPALLKELGKRVNANPTTEFAFTDLKPGRYALAVARSHDGPIEAHAVVEVTHGFATYDLELPPLPPENFLAVRVRGPDGASLEGATFALEHKKSRGSSSARLNPIRRESEVTYLQIPVNLRGSYYSEAVVPDEFILCVEHENFGATFTELVGGQRELEVNFAEAAFLNVSLAGFEASQFKDRLTFKTAMIGAEGNLNYLRLQGAWGYEALSQSALGAHAPGAYRLQLWLEPEKKSRRGSKLLGDIELKLKPGANDIEFVLPELCDLAVRVSSELRGSLELKRVGVGPGKKVLPRFQEKIGSNRSGFAPFEDVPVGDYVLTASLKTGRTTFLITREIELKSGAIDFVLSTPELCNFAVVVRAGITGQINLERAGDDLQDVEVRYYQTYASIGEDGRALFKDVPVGTYEVSTSIEGAFGSVEASIPNLVVLPKLKAVPLELPELHDLRVVIENNPFGSMGIMPHSLNLWPAGQVQVAGVSPARGSINGQGRVHFERVPAGDYVLLLNSAYGLSLSGYGSPERLYKNRIPVTIPTEEVSVDWDTLAELTKPALVDFSVEVLNAPTGLKLTMQAIPLTRVLGFPPIDPPQIESLTPTEVDADGRVHFQIMSVTPYHLILAPSEGPAKTIGVSASPLEVTLDWSNL